MTEKQKEFIQIMCEVLDYDFSDLKHMNTKEASEWIKDNIDDYNYYKGGKKYD